MDKHIGTKPTYTTYHVMDEALPLVHRIQGTLVEPPHIGYRVTYVAPHLHGDASKGQVGKIKRWNQTYIFVDFGKNTQACDPRYLVWG